MSEQKQITNSEGKPNGGEQLSLDLVRDNVAKLTGGRTITVNDLIASSPVKVPESRHEQAATFLTCVFGENELINVVNDFKEVRLADGSSKYAPMGAGKTKPASYFADLFGQEDCGLKGGGGIFVRINPVRETGTGKNGVYTDADVVGYRHALIEGDGLDLDEQASLLASLVLPLVAITTSGRRSLHGIVKVDCASADDYLHTVKSLLYRLRIFGIDRVNGNPSRFTRLAGALRVYDGIGDRLQRLLYLNPAADGTPIIGGGR